MNLVGLHNAILEKNEPDISLCTYCMEPIHEGSCIEPTSEGADFFFSIGNYYVDDDEQDHIIDERS